MIEFSSHARQMIAERGIDEARVWRVIDGPENKSLQADGNVHYFKKIEEQGGRVLRVIINETVEPHRIVTAVFDRRLRER